MDFLFQKKFREALCSRMRSSRKQEYEQLALQYKDDKKWNEFYEEAFTPTLTVEETKKLLDDGSCESEWELL